MLVVDAPEIDVAVAAERMFHFAAAAAAVDVAAADLLQSSRIDSSEFHHPSPRLKEVENNYCQENI